jgi:WD40 repeat protein
MIRWREPVDRPEEKDRPRKPVAVRTLDTAGATPLALVWGSVPQAKAKQSRLYVASSDRTVKVYGENGGLLGNLTGHGDWVYSVAVSPDGTRFASGSADGTVLLWDGATNRLLGTLVQLTPGRDESLVVAAPGALGAPAPGAKGKAR